MTVKEAFDSDIRRIRIAKWIDPLDHFELVEHKGGFTGIGRLWSPRGNAVCEQKDPKSVVLGMIKEWYEATDWIAYDGAIGGSEGWPIFDSECRQTGRYGPDGRPIVDPPVEELAR